LSLCFFSWAPRHEGVLGEWRYSSKHSSSSAIDGGERSASRPGLFTPRERTSGAHWIGGWVVAVIIREWHILEVTFLYPLFSSRSKSGQYTACVGVTIRKLLRSMNWNFILDYQSLTPSHTWFTRHRYETPISQMNPVVTHISFTDGQVLVPDLNLTIRCSIFIWSNFTLDVVAIGTPILGWVREEKNARVKKRGGASRIKKPDRY